MKIEDFNKLKRLMDRTMSGVDGERLMAIDKANEIVRAAGRNWSQILDRVVSIDVPIEAAERSEEGPSAAAREAFQKKVAEAFATIEESDPRGSFADFIGSLKDQWDRNGRLSSAQLEALWSAKSKAEEKRR